MARDDGRTGSTLPADELLIRGGNATPEIAALIDAWEAADREEAQATRNHSLVEGLLRSLTACRDQAYRRSSLAMDAAGRALEASGPVVAGAYRYSGMRQGSFYLVVRMPLPFTPEPDGPPVAAHSCVEIDETA